MDFRRKASGFVAFLFKDTGPGKSLFYSQLVFPWDVFDDCSQPAETVFSGCQNRNG
jgi:hypothetical protein